MGKIEQIREEVEKLGHGNSIMNEGYWRCLQEVKSIIGEAEDTRMEYVIYAPHNHIRVKGTGSLYDTEKGLFTIYDKNDDGETVTRARFRISAIDGYVINP